MDRFGVPLALLFVIGADAFGSRCHAPRKSLPTQPPTLPADATQLLPNTTVAFFGDQGCNGPPSNFPQPGCWNPRGSGPEEVLKLIRRENAAFVIHAGDFDYVDQAAVMGQLIDETLGEDFPYFATIGNHDLLGWGNPGSGDAGYSNTLNARLERFGGDEYCWGDYGVFQACQYKGIMFVLSGVGTWWNGFGDEHAAFIDETFTNNPQAWKVCTWHKNQRSMQIGGKFDETGWETYEMCAHHGAIVATGHEHSYCRSKTMSSFRNPTVVQDSEDQVTLDEDSSFVFVSGLGGYGIRNWNQDLIRNEWWASVAASDNDVAPGVLFCTFNVDGREDEAECYFKDVTGKEWDRFTVTSRLSASKPVSKAKRGGKRCELPSLFELAVAGSDADAWEAKDGAMQCDQSVLVVEDGGGRVALRFEGVPLDKGSMASVEAVRLQLYGARKENEPAKINIRAEAGPSAPLNCAKSGDLSTRPLTRLQATWQEVEDEATGWERHEVWVSVDLKHVVEEVVNADGWTKGDALTVILEAEGSRAFMANDRSECLAPTLAIHSSC